jgi:ArsR family transcriptional regulator
VNDIDSLQAEVMKALAHPRRLQVLHILAAGPSSVAAIATALGMTQPNTSQHLAVMRQSGVVEADRSGREVRYRLADPQVTTACALMRGVLERRLQRLAEAAIQQRSADSVAPATGS